MNMKRVISTLVVVAACWGRAGLSPALLASEAAGSASKPSGDAITPATNSPGPKIHFETPVYDFGKVVGNQVVWHEFKFENVGGSALIISNVQTTCGCASATNSSKVVAPGKSGIVSVEFHPDHFTGPVSKTVKVFSNDTNQPVADLELKGIVWRPIEVTPTGVTFTSNQDSPSNNVRVLRIVNRDSRPLTLSPPQTNQKTIAAEIRTNQFGKEYDLVVSLVPPLGAGNIFGEIKLKTSSSEMPLLTIPVFALARPKK
jgi:hypothetical protein